MYISKRIVCIHFSLSSSHIPRVGLKCVSNNNNSKNPSFQSGSSRSRQFHSQAVFHKFLPLSALTPIIVFSVCLSLVLKYQPLRSLAELC